MRRAVSGGIANPRAVRLSAESWVKLGSTITTACRAAVQSAVYVSDSSCGLHTQHTKQCTPPRRQRTPHTKTDGTSS